MDTALHGRWITTESEFMALAPAWNELAIKNNYSVFHYHEWFVAAWQWQDKSSILCIYCVFQANRLIGIFPLICRTQHYKKIPFQQLQFLTVPDTQFCDLIVAQDQALPALSECFKALAQTPIVWDKLQLDYLTVQSTLYQHHPTLSVKSAFPIQCQIINQHEYVQCMGTFQDYYQQRTKKFIKSHRNIHNRWKNQKNWSIHHYRTVSANQLDVLLAQWKTLVNHSWKKSTDTTLLSAKPRAFLHRLSHAAIQQQWFSLFVLSLNNTWIACEYQLHIHNQCFALRSDYHADYQHLSPGDFLQHAILKACFESNTCHAYYFGPGLNPYKKRWATHRLPLIQCTAYQTTWRGKILSMLDKQRLMRQKWSFEE